MTGEARLWNTMRSRYATATPALIPEYERGGAVAYRDRIVFQLRHSLASPVMFRASQM